MAEDNVESGDESQVDPSLARLVSHLEDPKQDKAPAESEPVANEAEPQVSEDTAPKSVEPKPHQVDKGLQRMQQEFSAFKTEQASRWDKLEAAIAKLSANPTEANRAAVEKQAEKMGIDIDALPDEDLTDNRIVKSIAKEQQDRIAKLEERLAKATAQFESVTSDHVLSTVQKRWLGEFPGLTGDDFREAFEQVAERVRGYGLSDEAADKVATDLLREQGRNRLASRGSDSDLTTAKAPPKTATATTKVLPKAGSGIRPKPEKSMDNIGDVMNHWAEKLDGATSV